MLDAKLQSGIDACKAINLVDYIGTTTQLRKASAREYVGPCPKCGGRDRFRVSDKGWFCRQCTGEPGGGGGHWGDVLDFVQWMYGDRLMQGIERITGRRVIDPNEIKRIQQERQQRDAERLQAERDEMQAALQRLQVSGVDETYHTNLDTHPEGRELWRKRGLSDDVQDYYNLGYHPARQFRAGDEVITSPTLTIPYYEYAGPGLRRLVGLRHRLMMTDAPAGKYRPEIAGLGNHLFYTDHEQPMQSNVLIVEGEIKALVTWDALYQSGRIEAGHFFANHLSVVGTPGHSLKADLVSAFDGCERIWICLDPDANRQAAELAKVLGERRCKIIKLPDKIDDLINLGIIDAGDIFSFMEAR